jgi:hypothetical protein
MESDDPYELLKDEARDFAKEKADGEINSCCKFVDESLVIENGQNEHPFRLFTFRT